MKRAFVLLVFPIFLLANWQNKISESVDKLTQTESKSSENYKSIVDSALQKALKELSSRGYLNTPNAKIPLPQELQKAAKLAKKVGGDKWAKDLTTSMNSAATSAVGGAAKVFSNTIRGMSEADLKKVMSGNSDSFTHFLRDKSSAELEKVFKPIIKKMMSENRFATAYNGLNSYISKKNVMNSSTANSIRGMASKIGADGYLPSTNEDLNDYITRKTLDGLFVVMGEKEKSLRDNGVSQNIKNFSSLLK